MQISGRGDIAANRCTTRPLQLAPITGLRFDNPTLERSPRAKRRRAQPLIERLMHAYMHADRRRAREQPGQTGVHLRRGHLRRQQLSQQRRHPRRQLQQLLEPLVAPGAPGAVLGDELAGSEVRELSQVHQPSRDQTASISRKSLSSERGCKRRDRNNPTVAPPNQKLTRSRRHPTGDHRLYHQCPATSGCGRLAVLGSSDEEETL